MANNDNDLSKGGSTHARHRRRLWMMMAIGMVTVIVFALPWPRATAQRLWDRLTVHRIEIVQISRPNLPESVTGAFTMDEEKRSDPQPVASVEEAERVAGFKV